MSLTEKTPPSGFPSNKGQQNQVLPKSLKNVDADAQALGEACRSFEGKYGIEAFLDTMASIMQARLGDQGLSIEFIDDDDGDEIGEQT